MSTPAPSPSPPAAGSPARLVGAHETVEAPLDAAAVEGALDRALTRRLPELLQHRLDGALVPLAREVATALADVEFSVRRLSTTEERARVAEQRARLADDALGAARLRAAVLEEQVAGLTAQLRRAQDEVAQLQQRRTWLLRRRAPRTARA